MDESWLDRGVRMIEAFDRQLPVDMPLDERKKAIQAKAWHFHGGTSWGRKVWPKAKRVYFGRVYGDKPKDVVAGVPEGYLSPLERLMSAALATPPAEG